MNSRFCARPSKASWPSGQRRRNGAETTLLRQSQEAAREVARGEGAQVVGTLADADRMHREAEALGEGDQHAAARSAVELGHDEAAHLDHGAEGLDLGVCVLA